MQSSLRYLASLKIFVNVFDLFGRNDSLFPVCIIYDFVIVDITESCEADHHCLVEKFEALLFKLVRKSETPISVLRPVDVSIER